MSDTPRFGLMEWLCLILVVSVAASARAAYLATCARYGNTAPVFEVQGEGPLRALPGETDSPRSEIADLAQNVRDERWFGGMAPLCDQREETAHVAPGYPWLLGMLGRFHDNPAVIMRWAQCGLGALTALCCFLFVRRAFASTLAGGIAGMLAALHPFWIVNSGELADGVLTTFLVTAALTLGARGSQVGGPFTSLLYGLTLAALAMVRAAFLPFAAFAFVWYLARCREVRSGWFAALLAVLGFANGLAPWAVRNWRTFDAPLPVADSAYLHLWMGTNPAADGSIQDEKALRESLPPELLAELLAEPNQPRRYARLAPELLDQVRADPPLALGKRFDAAIAYVLGAHWRSAERLSTERSGDDVSEPPEWISGPMETCLRGSLIALVLLAAAGWRLSSPWARQARLATLGALFLPLPYLLTHAEELAGPRLPFDAVLICYAAYTIAWSLPGFARTPAEAAASDAEHAS